MRKLKVQIRRVNSQEIFSSYLGIEIRLIITDAEISEDSLINSGLIDVKKNWGIRSLYRDEDVRALIQLKVHERMTQFISKEPEFDEWPSSPSEILKKPKSSKLDKMMTCIVQPENYCADVKDDEKKTFTRPKPELAKDMYFECLKETYDDCDLEVIPVDCEDIIVKEKGKDVFRQMMEKRKATIEKRKMKETFFSDPKAIFVKHNQAFNSEDEKKKTQERQ